MRPTLVTALVVAVLSATALPAGNRAVQPGGRLAIRIARHVAGAPVTLGVPFPPGALRSPDHVRVLTRGGLEIPSQVTEVTTWEPVDPGVKWIWVFFFADEPAYVLEYGDGVRRRPVDHRLEVVNNARDNGLAEITTGPLRFVVRQGEGGFLDSVSLDLDGNGFDPGDLIAAGLPARGAFADLLDSAGPDASRAVIHRTAIDRGSGPLHAVLRIDGEFRYGRADNHAAPFVTRIHAYAGRPYFRVLHTYVYTGVPDQHRRQDGDYPHVATQTERLIAPDPTDEGWTRPEDRLAALGLRLSLRLGPDVTVRTAVHDESWWSAGPARAVEGSGGPMTVRQHGPKPDRIPPVPVSSPTARLDGFSAEVLRGDRVVTRAERAPGWIDVVDGRRGVAVGVKHFFEEYPKALDFDPGTGELSAYLWSPSAGPMSFARATNVPANEGAVENWAQGIAKTSELIYVFHGRDTGLDAIARTLRLVHEPPVASVDPAWYGATRVFGALAPRADRFPALERALDYKFDWMLFNQRWQPWYGMFDHGDMMNTFDGAAWSVFGHNEPAQDFMWWLQFVRTGEPRYYDAALAFSRHTMDVDNTHWPARPPFAGDTNYPLDYWRWRGLPEGSPYVGAGRRHATQHWMHILSAHVWVQGWMAAYYLAGEQRGLDVARLTADFYLRRIWGDHDLTGRRLYLSVWNLTEVWDATKDPRYKAELDDRVARMLALQHGQADSLVIDRYGYTNVYASHGLERYFDATGRTDVRTALVRHARRVRDNPPLDHWMESYLSSIHSLTLGYRFTGDTSFVDELRRRLEPLAVEALPQPITDAWTQAELFRALERTSHLPDDPNRFRPPAQGGRAGRTGGTAGSSVGGGRGGAFGEPRRAGWAFTNGLRIYGWTTAFTVPYALAVLDDAGRSAGEARVSTNGRTR